MRFIQRRNLQQFFSSLTILSVTFTQVVPAWALRPEMDKAGVEEALLVRGGGTAASFGGSGSINIPPELIRKLRLDARPLDQRLGALSGYAAGNGFGNFLQAVSDRFIPLQRRVAVLDDFLTLALDDSILRINELTPELLVALLTGNDVQTITRARVAFNALEKICPTCGDRLYYEHEQGKAKMDFNEHDRLHVRTAIATAVEFLNSPSGSLPVVKRILDGDHSEEPARSLGVMEIMLSALYKNDSGDQAPGVSAVRLGNDARVFDRLSALTEQSGPVILLLRHPRTVGDEADHWVSVRSLNADRQTVGIYVNGEEETLSWKEFQRDYLPSGNLYGLLTADQRAIWSQTVEGRVFSATPQELTSVYGCCGIIITYGRRSGEGQFASMQDLAYRGQDNAGISFYDQNGLETVKEVGSPTNLIRALEIDGQGFPEEGMAWFLETFPKALLDSRSKTALEKLRQGGALNNQEKRLIHQLWMGLAPEQRAAIAKTSRDNAREILDSHNYRFVEPTIPGQEGLPTGVKLPLRKDHLYWQRFYAETSQAVVSPLPGRPRKEPGEVDQWNSVGRGNQGDVWSGRSFLVPVAKDGSHKTYVEALQAFQREVNQFYDYELSYLRDRLRFHLASRLDAAIAQGKLTQGEASEVMRDFLRLFETVAEGRDIRSEDAEIWRGIWSLVSGTTVWFSGHVAADPVRHVFRLQTGVVGILKQHPVWRKQVEDKFSNLLRADKVFEKRGWFQDWLVENFSNTPSKAFEALIGWFQEEFIPENVRKRMGIEFGRVDSVTLGYMEVFDKVVGHDRWATVGSKEAKDAQPHTDTGFLAGIPSGDLQRLVLEAKTLTEKSKSLTLSSQATPEERDQVQNLLSQHFLVLAVRYLADHPDREGRPQRSTPHNGDLDSGVQTGIRPRLKENGYRPVYRTVDEKGETHSETILTDTWGLLGLHEYVYDSFRKDTLIGLTDGFIYLPEKKNEVGFMPDAYRKKWNEIMDNLEKARAANQRALSVRGANMQIAEEVSHRIANLEFARGILLKPGEAGSEIGAGLMTTIEPRLQAFVSHNRPIYLMAVRDADGKLVWQVSSDYRTSLRLFERDDVAKGVRESNELFQWKESELDALDKKGDLSADDKEKREAEIFKEAERKQKAINNRFKLELMVTFKGEDKYIHTVKEFNPETKQWQLIIEVSTLEGKPIARYRGSEVLQSPPERESKNIKVEKNKAVEVDIASRFGFPSFGEKEMHQIPLALRETRFWYGLRPDGTLDMSREAVSQRFGETVDYGLNRQKLLDWFREGGDTILITGVGSSENDALAAEAFFKSLLPGVKVIVKDPSTLLNTAADFNPKTTMVVGISWSGTTALTLSILESLRERGLLCCAITGNPDKEIGGAARDSGGVVKAHTRQEVAVYTTVGFSTILYDLMLMANYLNLLKEKTETDLAKKTELQKRRQEVAASLYSVPEVVWVLRDLPERDLTNKKSYLHEVGVRLAPYNGAGFVGPDPSLPEIALKIGEVRNSGHTVYEYSDDDPWHLIRPGMPDDLRKGWFVDATSLEKLPRALAWIQEANRRGQHLVVQTFDEGITFTPEETNAGLHDQWRQFNDHLKTLGQVDIFRVPKVHSLVQPIINVQIGAPLATTTAKAAGLSSESRDAPKNLAKSVTVQSQGRLTKAMRIQDFVQAYQKAAAGAEETVMLSEYMDDLSQRWASLDTVQRAIQRLPMRMQEIIGGLSTSVGFNLNREKLAEQFGERLERLKKIVILSSEDKNAAIAARMAQELLEYRESITTNSEKEKIFEKNRAKEGQGWDPNTVERLISGDLYEIRFIRSPRDDPKENRIVISRMREEEGGKWKSIGGGEKGELVLFGDESGKNIFGMPPHMLGLRRGQGEGAQYQVNGQWYAITADKGRGVNLTAVEPELLGVDVELANIEDPADLSKLAVDPENTLVVVLSRSHQLRKEDENSIIPIASAGHGRDRKGMEAVLKYAPVKSENQFSKSVAELKGRYPQLAVFFAGSKDSFVKNQQNVGMAQLPFDLDVVDATQAFFLALLRMGIDLGSMKGVSQSEVYRESLEVIPALAASAVASSYRERVDVGQELFDPAVQGVRITIGHRPLEIRYNKRAETITFLDGEHQVGVLPVLVDSFERVRGFKDAVNSVTVGGRVYDVTYRLGYGLVVQSRLPDYEGGGSLRDALVSLVQNKFNHPYTNWFAVGGGADFASAGLYRRFMAVLGNVQAHALVVDAFVHGPLAEVDDRLSKWADQTRRRGVNPDYDPNSMTDLTQKDAAVVLLGTDKRGSSAADIDGQRVVTRSGRLFKVVTNAARNNSQVLESGAFHVISLPEAPNLLSVIPHMILAPIFAYELGQSIRQDRYHYQPGSSWANIAQLPQVIPAGEVSEVRVWQDDLKKVLGDRPDLIQWFTDTYAEYRENPATLIKSYTSAAYPDMTSYVVVIPFQHMGGTKEPIREIAEKIGTYLQFIDRKLEYDTRYYWRGFQEGGGGGSVGLLHIAFRTSEISEKEARRVILRAVERFVRQAQKEKTEAPVPVLDALGLLDTVHVIPDEGLANEIMALHDSFSVDSMPRVIVRDNPSGEPGRFLVVAVDLKTNDRIEAVVREAISSLGGAVSTAHTAATDGLAVMLADFKLGKPSLVAKVTNKIERGLLGSKVSTKFMAAFPISKTQHYLYGAYRAIQVVPQPIAALSGEGVEGTGKVSALVMILPDDSQVGELKNQVIEIMKRNGLTPVISEKTYQENPTDRPVRYLRFDVGVPYDDDAMLAIYDGVEKLLSTQAGAATTAAVSPLPGLLLSHRAEIEGLVLRYGEDRKVHFQALEGPQARQATLLIIGERDEPGILDILTHTLATAGMNIVTHGVYDTDHAGLSFVVVDAALEMLGQEQPRTGRSVLEQIGDGISERYPTPEEIALRSQLINNQNMNTQEVELLMSLYHQYHGLPRHSVDPGAADGETYISAIAPYSPPLPDLKELIAKRVGRAMQEKAVEYNLQPGQVPNVVPVISFQPVEKLHPAVLVLVSLNLGQEEVFHFDLDELVEETIAHLSGESQAGAEESPIHVGFSIGGTKAAVSVLTPAGILGEPDKQPKGFTWQELAADRSDQPAFERAVQALVESTRGALIQFRISPNRLAEVGISWAGPGDYEAGRVKNDKTDGFREMMDLKGALERALQKAFNKAVTVRIMHDGAAGAMGEVNLPNGALHENPNGIGIILGTGIGAGFIENGKPVYAVPGKLDAFLGEIGWHLVRLPDGQYVYRGAGAKLDTPFPSHPVKGELRFEQRLAGPWLAARFIEVYRQAGRTDADVLGTDIGKVVLVSDKQRFSFPGEAEALVVENAAVEKRALQKLTDLALQGDSLARDFIEQAGTEFGQAVAALRQVYAGRPFVQGRVVVMSSLGENLGKGVVNNEGEDLFLAAARKAAGTDVVRSQVGWERELSSFTPVLPPDQQVKGLVTALQSSESLEEAVQAVGALGNLGREAQFHDAALTALTAASKDLDADISTAAAAALSRLQAAGVEELDGEATPEIRQAAQDRGWKPVEVSPGVTLFQTPQGGWVSPNAVRGIDPIALITQGSWVRGAQTKIGSNTRITRSLVENAEIGERTLIEDGMVRTDPKLTDSWSWNDTAKVGPVSITRVGSNVRITATAQGELAEIINAVIGNTTTIQGGSVRNSEIGAANRLVRAKVGLTYTADNVTIAAKNGAPTEVSESWLGWGRTIDEESYNEQYSPNFIRRATVDADGSVKFATVENIPAVVLQSFSTIDASYDGSGKPGKEFNSSRHGEGVKWPGSVQGPLTNTVLMVHQRFNDSADLLNEHSMNTSLPNGHLTALGPLSYSRRAEGVAAGMIWGQVRPGSERHGLSSSASDGMLWMFEHAQLAIQEILREMHRQVDNHARTAAWNPEERAAAHAEVDHLPRYMLETGKALAHLARDTELEAQYDRHLAGEGKQIEQLTLADLLKTDSLWRDRWQDPQKELFPETDRKRLAQLPFGIDADPSKNSIGKGARIIGARAQLEGVTIPDGATVFVYGSYVQGGTLHDGSVLRSSVSINTEVNGADVSSSRFGNARLARGVKAAGAVATDSTVGEGTTLESYTRLVRSSIGKNGSVGSPIADSALGDAVTDHHLLADLKGVRTPNYDVGGVSIPNLTNFSAGARVRNATLYTTMTGANMEIGSEGDAEVTTGFGSFVVNRLTAGEQVSAFAFSRGTGLQAKQPGSVLTERQNTVMRIVMGKTLKELPQEAYPAFDQLFQAQISSVGLTTEAPKWKLDTVKNVKELNAQTAFVNGQWVYQPSPDEAAGTAQGHGKYQWQPKAAGAEETRILDRRDAIQAIVDRGASGYTEVTVEGPTPPVILQGDEVKRWTSVEAALGTISSGQMEVYFGGSAGNKITVRAAAGLEEIGGPAISVLPGAGIGASKPSVIERTPGTSRLAPANVTRTTVPGGTLPSTSGVLGTFSYADTRSQINLLPELQLTTSTAATQTIFGVIAGPADTRGLAAGIALSRRAFGPDGNVVPVIFIVENQKEEKALISLGVSQEQIIRVDPSGRYRTVDAAVGQAGEWLSGMYGVTRVVELGVKQPVPSLLLRLLENLFGIRLEDSESIRAWQQVIDQATLVLQA